MCNILFQPFRFLSVTNLYSSILLIYNESFSWSQGGTQWPSCQWQWDDQWWQWVKYRQIYPICFGTFSQLASNLLTRNQYYWRRISLIISSPRASRLHCLRDPPNCHPAQCPKSLPNRPRLSQQHFKLQNHREHSAGGWTGVELLINSFDDHWQTLIGNNSLQMLSLIRRRR